MAVEDIKPIRIEQINDPITRSMITIAYSASNIANRYHRLAAAGKDLDAEIKEETEAHADDLVTVADRKVQHHIIEELHKLEPDASFVAEEILDNAGVSTDPKALKRYILDPIDGTKQFRVGEPNYACCVLARQLRQADGTYKTTHAVATTPANGKLLAADGMGAIQGGFNHLDFSLPLLLREMPASPKAPATATFRNNHIDLRLSGLEKQEVQLKGTLLKEKMSVRNIGGMVTALLNCATGKIADFNVIAHPKGEWDWAAAAFLAKQCGCSVEVKNYANMKTEGKDYPILYCAGSDTKRKTLKQMTEQCLGIKQSQGVAL